MRSHFTRLAGDWLPALSGLLFSYIAFGTSESFSQEQPHQMAPADRSSPRATLKTFIDVCNELNEPRLKKQYFDRDAEEDRSVASRVFDCLDFDHLPSFERLGQAGEAANCLMEVLDRVTLPPESEFPGPDDVEASDDSEPLNVEIDRAFEEHGIPISRTVRVSTAVWDQKSLDVIAASLEDTAHCSTPPNEWPSA